MTQGQKSLLHELSTAVMCEVPYHKNLRGGVFHLWLLV